MADNETADTLDKFLFLFYGRRCAAWNRQAVYREPKDIAKEVRKMETYTLGYKFRIYPNRTWKTSSTARFTASFRISTTSRGASRRMKANHTADLRQDTNCSLTSRSAKLHGCPEADSMALQESLRNLDRKGPELLCKGQDTRASSRSTVTASPIGRAIKQTVSISSTRESSLPGRSVLWRIKQSRDFDGRILCHGKPGFLRKILRFAFVSKRKESCSAQTMARDWY